MGNCMSGKAVQVDEAARPINRSIIRVLQAAEGRVVEVEVPDLQMSMTVGELMLEFPPGNFVAHFDDINASKRASPLGADVEATSGLVYVLFPMPRLHSRVAAHELSAFATLLHLHDQQLLAAACKISPPSKQLQHRLFAAISSAGHGVRVVPLPVPQEEGAQDCGDIRHVYIPEHHVNNGTSGLLFSGGGPMLIQAQQQQNSEEAIIFSPNSSYDPQLVTRLTICHSQMQAAIKSKPWVPKLETIKESGS